MKQLLLPLICASVLGACTNSNQNMDSILSGDAQKLNEQKINAEILIVDQNGKAIPNAEVMIGLSGEITQANAQGQLAVTADWVSAEPVTIQAPGFVRATYLAQEPGVHVYKLNAFYESPERYELTGITTGYKDLSKDKFADFALIMPALTKQQLFNFNMALVMSPEMDKLEVIGPDSEMPSNVSLPKQKESYFLPITLDKPKYRFFFDEPGQKRVYAARGRFNFKDVVKELNDKRPFHELVNHFQVGGGSIRDIVISQKSTALDIPVDEINYTTQKAYTAPTYTKDDYVLTASVGEFSGYLLPTDVKNPASGQKGTLAVADGQPQLMLGVLKKNIDMAETAPPGSPISATLIPFEVNVKPEFLPIVAKPVFAGANTLKVGAPQHQLAVAPLAMYLSLSKVQGLNPAKPQIEKVTRYWEVYGPTWENEVQLPEWPIAMQGTRRWAVSYVASSKSSAKNLGPSILEDATHVTTSYIDFQ